MPAFTVRGKVTPDRRLELQLPPDAPLGEAEAIVTVSDAEPVPGSKEAVFKALAEIRRTYHGSGRTKEEVDRELAEERASWDDDE